ncbi:MAG: nucleotidyltransferase family protein [Clostridia bacterium]|nr:nucleotidyltransferase family protein [Clostridia bacterium]
MRVLGIIAEYDPLHNGHVYHLQSAKQAVRPDYTVIALSSCFTQRGAPALLSPAGRAGLALSAGADAVFALPALYTVRDAEHYALGAVTLLSALGVTDIAFGAETDDLPLLSSVSALLADEPPEWKAALSRFMAGGLGYPAAAAAAAEEVLPGAGGVLSCPNNTLAVSYLRAIRSHAPEMIPHVIRRTGAYHAESAVPSAPSASAVRSAVARGNWQSVFASVPPATADLIRQEALARRFPDPDRLSGIILPFLRLGGRGVFAAPSLIPEGLEDRITGAASQASSFDGLIRLASSKRYPDARLRRICVSALLGMTDDLLLSPPDPSVSFLLGIRYSAGELFTLWKESGRTEVLTGMKAVQKRAPVWYQTEARAYEIYACLTGRSAGFEYSLPLLRC